MNPPKQSDASGTEAPRALYAVVRHGGHQYRVTPGDRLLVDRLPSEVGSVVGLEPVLLLADGDGVQVEAASLEGIRIAATVAGHRRGRKLRVFTFKPKKRHRRTLGFRAELTELVVDRFLAKGEPLPEPLELEEPETAEIKPAEMEPEEVALAAAEAEPEPVRGRRRGSRAAAAAPAVEAVAEAPPPEPDTEAKPVARPRRRPAATPAAVEAEATAHAPAEAGPASPPEAAAPASAEAAATSPPARRSRRATAAVKAESAEPEPAEPEGASPPPGASGTGRRRAVRKASPPEAGE